MQLRKPPSSNPKIRRQTGEDDGQRILPQRHDETSVAPQDQCIECQQWYAPGEEVERNMEPEWDTETTTETLHIRLENELVEIDRFFRSYDERVRYDRCSS